MEMIGSPRASPTVGGLEASNPGAGGWVIRGVGFHTHSPQRLAASRSVSRGFLSQRRSRMLREHVCIWGPQALRGGERGGQGPSRGPGALAVDQGPSAWTRGPQRGPGALSVDRGPQRGQGPSVDRGPSAWTGALSVDQGPSAWTRGPSVGPQCGPGALSVDQGPSVETEKEKSRTNI
ncbi:unnamed protein product [Arctogadus glacialis]